MELLFRLQSHPFYLSLAHRLSVFWPIHTNHVTLNFVQYPANVKKHQLPHRWASYTRRHRKLLFGYWHHRSGINGCSVSHVLVRCGMACVSSPTHDRTRNQHPNWTYATLWPLDFVLLSLTRNDSSVHVKAIGFIVALKVENIAASQAREYAHVLTKLSPTKLWSTEKQVESTSFIRSATSG